MEGIVIGAAGGFIAGLTIWSIQLLKEWRMERNDKDRVYNWLYKRTERHRGLTVGSPNDPRWVSSTEIASYTDLTTDRVRHICSIQRKIRLKMEKDLFPKEILEEKWGITRICRFITSYFTRENNPATRGLFRSLFFLY